MSKSIAIIGAGILGLSAAYKAAQQGMSVTIFEKQDFPPNNASSIAGGMLAPFSEIETLPINFVNAGLKGIEFWKNMLGETYPNCMQNTGTLFIAHPEDRHMLERFAQHLPSVSDNWEWVDKARIAALEPSTHGNFNKGLYIPQEANIHPLQALQALAQEFKKLGGQIIKKEVTPEELEKDHDWVIDCRGYVEGIDSEIRGIKGEIILLENHEFQLSRPVRLMHPRYPLYIIPRPNNIFAVGASVIENASEDDGKVFLRSAMELMSAAYSLHPSFGEAKVLDMSSAIRPAYLDNLPRIKVEQERNYIRCNGLFRHGYLLSPTIGNTVVSFIKTGKKNEDFPLFSGQFNHPISKTNTGESR